MPYPAPDLRAATPHERFFAGMRYAWWGVRVVATHTALWPYVVAPVAISLLLFFGTGFALWQGIGLLLGMIWEPGPNAATWVVVTWFFVRNMLRFAAIGTVALVLYFTAGLIATPFNDRLSEHVETMALGPYDEEFYLRVLLGDLAQSLAHSVLSLSLWAFVMVGALSLNLLPVLGSAASFAVGTLATAMFLARESMDGPLSRRRMSYGHKLRVVAQNAGVTLGFGLAASALLWIPFLNFLLLPMAVAGGTLMYAHLEQQGLVPDAAGKGRYVPLRARNAALADHELAAEPVGREVLPVREHDSTHT